MTAAETLFAIETTAAAPPEPQYVYVGPRDPHIGHLQIFQAGSDHSLCGLPWQSHWDVRDVTGRKVCRLCRAKLPE